MPKLRNVVVGFALALVAAAVAACGKSASSSSGETHFLAYCNGNTCSDGLTCICGVCTVACTENQQCNGHAPSAECLPVDASCTETAQTCDVGCSMDADCSALGQNYSCSDGSCRGPQPVEQDAGLAPGECPVDCSPAVAYPEDPTRSCVDTESPGLPICVCGESYGGECRKRVEDGTLWRVPAAPDILVFEPGAWTTCTSAEIERVMFSCDFADCPRPPPSTCSFEDFCDSGACGGFEFDEDGCRRQECTTDVDCMADERCLRTSITSAHCDYPPDGTCACSSPTIDLESNLCNPTSLVGPRGAWETIEMVEVQYLCSPTPPGTCTTTRTINPDGMVERSDDGVITTAQLTQGDLDILNDLVDGPEIRPGLRDGFAACEGITVDDYEFTLRIVLPDVTLERLVTPCLFVPGHPVEELLAVLRDY